MKKLLTILFTLLASQMFAQTYITKDTTFGTWNATISYIDGWSDSTETFININGLGEVGTDVNKNRVYGPHYWRVNGWNMVVPLAGVNHYPVFVTLQQPAAFRQAQISKPIFDLVWARFKTKRNARYGMGLSNGGWVMEQYLYYEPTLNDYSYQNYFTAIATLEGQIADDNYGADIYAYPNYFGHGAKNGSTHVIGFEQVNDNRAIGTMIKNMIDSVGSSSRYAFFWTNFGSSGHEGFNEMYNPSQNNWTLTNADVQASNNTTQNTIPIATGQNIYQWMLRQGDTTLPAAGGLTVSAGGAQTIELPTTSVTLTGTVTGGTAPYTYSWTKVSGPNTPTITSPASISTNLTGLIIGTYVYALTATDNVSATSNATVSITLNYSSADLSITSTNATAAVGTTASITSTTSPNHNIISTKWTKLTSPLFTAKKLVFIGSSTTAGYGTTGYVAGTTNDSSYVGRTLNYLFSQGLISTKTGVNLGQASTDIYDGQPSWYVPTGSQHSPLAGRNITAALALNPDIVICNYPTNSYDFLTMTEIMAAHRRIKATADSAGKVIFFTTTQPRPGFSPTEEAKLVVIGDSIRAAFPNNYIEFYKPLVDGITTDFKPAYNYGDGVHSNDAGHKQLFNRVIETNIFKSFTTGSTIVSPASNNTDITGFSAGTNKYQVSIVDARGLAASSVSTVTGSGGGGGGETIDVSAGAPQTKTMPTNQGTLYGSATGGTAPYTYKWSRVSGGTAVMQRTDSARGWYFGLQVGTTTFKLKVTDALGFVDSANVTITQNDYPTCNVNAPVVYNLAPTSPGEIYLTDASVRGWKGGDTVKIAGGDYPGGIRIDNFSGDTCRPINILFTGYTTTTSIRIQNKAQYFRILPVPGYPLGTYGIKTNFFGSTLSREWEAQGIWCADNNASVGVYIKTDVDTSNELTIYPNYEMSGIHYHHGKVTNVDGEGMYVGETAPDGDPYHFFRIPLRMSRVTINNMVIDSTGWDGIQLSAALYNNHLYNNSITHFGLHNIDGQRAGIILGGTTTGDVYNNTIKNGNGNGIEIFGFGTINVHDNLIDSVGNTNTNVNGEESIYVVNHPSNVEVQPPLQVNIYNNAINHPKLRAAIRNSTSTQDAPSNVYNNTFCIPGASANWQSTYLILDVPGTVNTNNTLYCGTVTPATPNNSFPCICTFQKIN